MPKATASAWESGQHILAYWPEGDRGEGYYPAKIVKARPDETVDIQWDDGSGLNNVPVAHLTEWEEGQQVQAYWNEDDDDNPYSKGDAPSGYYPAKIVKVRPNGTVDIDWEDGETEAQTTIPVARLRRRQRGRPNLKLKQASILNLPAGDKQQAFRRLAEQRTGNAIKYIRLIQNLSDRRNYHYSTDEVTKIFTTLREAIDSAEKKFAEGVPRKNFKL